MLLWLEGAGPQLGGEILTAVQFTVTLQDVDRLQTHLNQKGNPEGQQSIALYINN